MWQQGKEVRVFIGLGVTDMRKAINGLSILVQDEMEKDLFAGDLFAFSNRGRTIIKILYWDRNGFCLWQKRLERDRFKWPETEAEVLEINRESLGWLLDGLDIKHAHQRLHYETVV